MLVYVHNQVPESRLITGWVNGNLYIPSDEVSGVLPIPHDIRVKSGMAEYQALLHSNQPQKFLALMQGTRKPVLPIHSREERDLFRQLVAENISFASAQWETAMKIWNGYADEHKEISYKVCITHSVCPMIYSYEVLRSWQLVEHLKIYFNGDWKSQANTKQTMAVTAKDRLPLKKALQDPRRSETAPLATESTMQLHAVAKGFVPLDPPAILFALPLPDVDMPDNTITKSPALLKSTSPARLIENPEERQEPVPTVETFQILSRKRAAEASTEVQPTKRKRQARSCRKCASGTECRGRKEVKYCTNKCKDCGKVDCHGRNPKKLRLPCNEGWE